MARLFLFLVALAFSGLASASDAASTAPAPAAAADRPAADNANEEIIVYGERDVARKRAILERDLRRLGYTAHDKDGYTVYRTDAPWEASIVLYDQGFMLVKRSPVRFEPPVQGHSALRYLWCVPPFTPLCIRPGGQLIGKRKLQGDKTRTYDAIKTDELAWQKALQAQGDHQRINEELPRQLVSTWDSGAPIEQWGPDLPTPDARRAAILDLWATRADTPEGAEARAVIGDFVRFEIQSSDHPASPDEIAAAEAKCACDQHVLEGSDEVPTSGP